MLKIRTGVMKMKTINEFVEPASQKQQAKRRILCLEREIAAAEYLTEYLASGKHNPKSAHEIGNWLYEKETVGPLQEQVWQKYIASLGRMSFRFNDADPGQKNFWTEASAYVAVVVGGSMLIAAKAKEIVTRRSMYTGERIR